MDEDLQMKPILITGAARSGTSMTAGIVHLCGAWGGKMTGPTPYNRKGQFENLAIRNGLIKPILKNMGVDSMGQHPLPKTSDFFLFSNLAVENFRISVLRTIRSQGYRSGPWFYKGAKMCLMWPLWHRAFPDARWIIVRRRKEDIINSCLKTSFMRAFRDSAGWAGWVDHHIECFLGMAATGLFIQYVWPSKMIGNDFSQIEKIIENLGLSFDLNNAIDFIEPALWSGKI